MLLSVLASYNDLFDPAQPWRMIHAGCWAHARRKYYDVRAQFPGPCHHALGQIQQLYEVEREAKDLEAHERAALRQEKSQPIVESLLSWCKDQQSQVLPRSGLGGGATWQDRVPDGPPDTINSSPIRMATGRLWSAAGDGFFKSDDAGETWRRGEQGLHHGSEDWPLVHCEIDLRVDGALHYTWRHRNQGETGLRGVFREIMPPERIVHTELFDEDWTCG